MEINITKFFNEEDPSVYSASAMELGQDVARITWNNALNGVGDPPMLNTEEALQAMRDWAESSGGWDDEEIAAWSDAELNALFIQLVSGDRRQMELCEDDNGDIDWDEYQRLAEAGNISGSIYRAATEEIYYYLGN